MSERNPPFKDVQHLCDDNGRIQYEILLSTKEWQEFREIILTRDEHICTRCHKPPTPKMHPDDKGYYRKPTSEELEASKGVNIIDLGDGDVIRMQHAIPTAIQIKDPVVLHVHHLFYIWDHLPWEYELDALVTVCHACHEFIHKTEKILVYTNRERNENMELITCSKCFGTGYLSRYDYHYNGICFSCNGYKYI
jgi:hypothetical protein